MSSNVKRLLVEKREGFDLEAKALMKDLKDSLHIDCIDDLRLLNIFGLYRHASFPPFQLILPV